MPGRWRCCVRLKEVCGDADRKIKLMLVMDRFVGVP
jgi:hypothetical protein